MGDNGKTQEQKDKERSERFTKDPNSFIEISELICAAMKSEKSGLGVTIMVNNCKRSELDISQIELNHRFDLCRRQMDMASEMKKIAPAHGIRDFVRRGFK